MKYSALIRATFGLDLGPQTLIEKLLSLSDRQLFPATVEDLFLPI